MAETTPIPTPTTTAAPSSATLDQQIANKKAQLATAATAPVTGGYGYSTPRFGVPQGYARAGREPGIYKADGSRKVSNDYYDLENYPAQVLYTQSDDKRRMEIRETLFAKGYYRTNKMPTGAVDREDEYALAELLREANINQTEWEDYLNLVKQRPDKVTQGSGRPRVTVTSPDDLVVVANRLAIETLGRRLTPQEAQAFAQNYQQRQVAYQQQSATQQMTTQPPDAQTAAMTMLERKYGQEKEAYGYLKAVNSLARLVGAA